MGDSVRVPELVLVPKDDSPGSNPLDNWPVENIRHHARYLCQVQGGVVTSAHKLAGWKFVAVDSYGRHRYKAVESTEKLTDAEWTFISAALTADLGLNKIRGARTVRVSKDLARYLKERGIFPTPPTD